ncbi:MAG: thiamine-phosphate kinase [Rhizobiaceae bacterium]
MSREGEFEWIARYLAPLAGDGSFNLKDDAALLTVPDGMELVVTQDAILENIHFLPDDPVDTVAQKALRVNISDIVAKGAKPFAYTMALGVPDNWEDHEMLRFANGLEEDQKRYGLKLTGGDTYRSPDKLCIAITMFGAVSKGSYKSRLGAKTGDLLVVSGTIGDGAIGLKVATGKLQVAAGEADSHLSSYRLPNPPLRLAKAIAKFATSSMDISDGLLGDCRKLCEASGVSATIERSQIPLSTAVEKQIGLDPKLWSSVLGGGDDYQCLCTAAPQEWAAFQKAARADGIILTEIGKITGEGETSVSLTGSGVPLSQTVESFTHF